MGTQLPLPRKEAHTPFSAHAYCTQMAKWIKMPLGMEVGLDPSDIVLDWDPGPLPKMGAEPPASFVPCLLWLNSCMDQDATWYGDRPRPRPHCARWSPSSPPKRGIAVPPIFGPCLLWPNGWMDQVFKMPLGTKVGLSPGHIVLHGDPAPPLLKGVQPPLYPNFHPMSIVSKRPPISR